MRTLPKNRINWKMENCVRAQLQKLSLLFQLIGAKSQIETLNLITRMLSAPPKTPRICGWLLIEL